MPSTHRLAAMQIPIGFCSLVLAALTGFFVGCACGSTDTSLGGVPDPRPSGQAGTSSPPGAGGAQGAGIGGESGSGNSSGTTAGGSGPMPDPREDGSGGTNDSPADSGVADVVSDGAEMDAAFDAGDAPEVGADAGCTAPSNEEILQFGPEGRSCSSGPLCSGVSCCQSVLIPGGAFPMGRSPDGSDAFAAGANNETPEHAATVSPFYLDRFEVVVARFRDYVNAYNGTPPLAGEGTHPALPGSGWQSAWNAELPSTQAALRSSLNCASGESTWSENALANERMPINCTNWYIAFAFCIWDGARLPTEAEWEKASAGGDENRLYPWGAAAPEACRAGFGGTSPHTDVATHPLGEGRWRHADLAGSVWEWTLDWYDANWYSTGGAACVDCANLTPTPWRATRGGGWSTLPATASRLRAAFRTIVQPNVSASNVGFRCARSLP
jgi:formylglycine-generating enzyme